MTTQAQAAVETQRKKDLDAIRGCVNVGMPALMNDRATLDIRQSASVIGMVAKSPSSTRYIYTDGRKHPDAEELEPTTNGHSIGRWEGQHAAWSTQWASTTAASPRFPAAGTAP